ncbi:MAG TPA: hypothetical protein VKA34_02900 [Balneolales bacterium]|nr:hypothetical protein [Balneolales bacterium]
MKHILKSINITVLLTILFVAILSCSATSIQSLKHNDKKENLIEVTPVVNDYVSNVLKPVLDSYPEKDKLSVLIKVSKILIDENTGVNKNSIKPSRYIYYDLLEKVKLGFLVSFKISDEQKRNLKDWHEKYMKKTPADVFFAPSADEIIKYKAAFGCSHYARSFIAVVKAIGLMDKPEDLRYVISSKADDYNKALEKNDSEMTINGHQFVIAKIDAKWILINTSKSEWSAMPEGFSPNSIGPPKNFPIRFPSYPDVTFLFRKIGKDCDDDCNDNSLAALMNIYRSGDSQGSNFKWERFEGVN